MKFTATSVQFSLGHTPMLFFIVFASIIIDSIITGQSEAWERRQHATD
jgi:hypothetical protein